MAEYYGISECSNRAYGAAAALSYWVFRCRDRTRSPAMGTKTWSFFESSIRNAAEVSPTIEDYLQRLSDALIAHLRPAELTAIVKPTQRVIRVDTTTGEIQELDCDSALQFVSWRALIQDIAQDGFGEWDVLELCRARATIVQVLCRLRFEADRALGTDVSDEDFLEVEATSV